MYKSFDEENRKLEKMWNQQEENKSKTDDLLVHFLKNFRLIDYRAINEYKKNNKIVLAEGLRADELSLGDLVFEFRNFPDWAINSVGIWHTFYLSDTYSSNEIRFSDSSFPSGLENPTEGQISISANDKFSYFWIKEGDLTLLVIDCFRTARIITSSGPGGSFLSAPIPIFVDIFLTEFNKREYNEISSRKRKTS